MRACMVLIGLCGTLSAAEPAAGALAPNYQRLAELRAVLDTSEVTAARGAPIDRLEYVRSDLYRVSAGRCHVDVAIVGLPMPRGMVGARRFEARPGRRMCG
jgi:hypothetical protein